MERLLFCVHHVSTLVKCSLTLQSDGFSAFLVHHKDRLEHSQHGNRVRLDVVQLQ